MYTECRIAFDIPSRVNIAERDVATKAQLSTGHNSFRDSKFIITDCPPHSWIVDLQPPSRVSAISKPEVTWYRADLACESKCLTSLKHGLSNIQYVSQIPALWAKKLPGTVVPYDILQASVINLPSTAGHKRLVRRARTNILLSLPHSQGERCEMQLEQLAYNVTDWFLFQFPVTSIACSLL